MKRGKAVKKKRAGKKPVTKKTVAKKIGAKKMVAKKAAARKVIARKIIASEIEAAKEHHDAGVLVRGEAAVLKDGELPSGVTHEIVGTDPAGDPVLKRRRFYMV